MKSKFMTLLVILSISLVISGCGTGSFNDNAEGEERDTDEIELRVGGMSNEDNPSTIQLQEFAEKVEDKTDGRITMDIYPNNQLGDYTGMFEELTKGTIDLGLFSIPSQQDDRLEFIKMPYLVTDYDEAEDLYTRGAFIFDKTEELLKEQGVQLLGIRTLGYGGVAMSKELTNPNDINEDKGATVRVPDTNIFKSYAKEMGFQTTSIPWADLFTALQTGAADGVIGGQPTASYLEFRDVIEYYYDYRYDFEAMGLMVNEELWKEFDEEDQKVMQEAADELTQESIEMAEENDKKYLDKMDEEGIEIVEYDKEKLEEFAETVRENVWPEVEDEVGEDLLEELQDEVE